MKGIYRKVKIKESVKDDMKNQELKDKKIIFILCVIEITIVFFIYRDYYYKKQMDYESLSISCDKIIEDKLENVMHTGFYIYAELDESEDIRGYYGEKYLEKNQELKYAYIVKDNNEVEDIIDRENQKKDYYSYNELDNRYRENNYGTEIPNIAYVLRDNINNNKINLVETLVQDHKRIFVVFNLDLNKLLKVNIVRSEECEFRIRNELDGTIWGEDSKFSDKFYSFNLSSSGKFCMLDIEVKDNVRNKKSNLILSGTIICLIVLHYMIYILLKKNKNIDKLKKIRAKLEEEILARTEIERRYELAIEGSNDIIVEYNNINKELILSDKWINLMGYYKTRYKQNEMYKEIFKFIHKNDKYILLQIINEIKKDNDKDDNDSLCEFINYVKDENKKEFKYDFRILRSGTLWTWLSLRGVALYNENGEFLKAAGSLTDITDNKIKENRIEYLAYHDPLTGLKNLKRFMLDIRKFIDLWEIKNQKGAILFVDLDNFKMVNDTLGHDYGDELLKQVTKDIELNVNKDRGNVYRIAGDEFVIIINYFENIKHLKNMCQSIVNVFNKEFIIKNKVVNVTCSQGVSIYPCHSRDDKQLLINADIAMYKAKQNGKNRYEFFSSHLKEEMNKKLKMEQDLNMALKNNDFSLEYQPKINIITNEVNGYEALIRWYNKEENGYISPVEFIPLAESCGIIEELGYWIIEEVCKQISIWKSQNIQFHQIAINISPMQLVQQNFISVLKDILNKYNVKSNEIQLEITETTYMKDIEKNNQILGKLKKSGISIALDDFGTGYSSLSYLIDIPINTLKIDKSFVTGIQNDSVKKQIVQAIINISHNIDLIVVAEGVENQMEMEILKEMNCDIIQGYYYSKPMSGNKVGSFKVTSNKLM